MSGQLIIMYKYAKLILIRCDCLEWLCCYGIARSDVYCF